LTLRFQFSYRPYDLSVQVFRRCWSTGFQRRRAGICYGIDQKRRLAGADNQARFLDAFRLKTVPGSECLVNGIPAGPCNSYGNEDSWSDSTMAPEYC